MPPLAPDWAGNLSQQPWGCRAPDIFAHTAASTHKLLLGGADPQGEQHPLLAESWLLFWGLGTSLGLWTRLEGECWALSARALCPTMVLL